MSDFFIYLLLSEAKYFFFEFRGPECNASAGREKEIFYGVFFIQLLEFPLFLLPFLLSLQQLLPSYLLERFLSFHQY